MSISGILDIFNQLPAWQELSVALDSRKPLPALLLPRSARAPVLARLFMERQVPVILVTGRMDAAVSWQQALENWLPDTSNLLRLPEPTPLPYDRGPWSERTRIGRLQVFTRFMAGQHPLIPAALHPPLVLTSARALLQKTLPKRRFLSATRVLRLGGVIDLEKITEAWADIGYENVSVVEAAGQFSRRGGILDIYPVSTPFPVRIELFGDEIDTMRYFDPATQRSLTVHDSSQVESIIIPPAREALPGVAREYALSIPESENPAEGSLPSWRDDIAGLRMGNVFPTLEYYMPLLYPQPASLLDYLPENALVVVDDWPALETAVADFLYHADQMREEQSTLPPGYPSPVFNWQPMAADLQWWQPLILGEQEVDEMVEGERPLTQLAESFEPGPRYGGQMRPLMTQLRSAQREGDRIVVVSRQAARLAELWREENKGAATFGPGEQGGRGDRSLLLRPSAPPLPQDALSVMPADGILTFVNGGLAEGFTLVRREDNEILLDLLTDAEIFGWNRPAPRRWRSPAPLCPRNPFCRHSGRRFCGPSGIWHWAVSGAGRAQYWRHGARIFARELRQQRHALRACASGRPPEQMDWLRRTAAGHAPPGRTILDARPKPKRSRPPTNWLANCSNCMRPAKRFPVTLFRPIPNGRRNWKPASPTGKQKTNCASLPK